MFPPQHALLPAVRDAGLNEVIIADGFSCREQISQMTERQGMQFAEVLQLAIEQGPAGPERKLVDQHTRAVQHRRWRRWPCSAGFVRLRLERSAP
jgi:hypothetical protein